MSEVIYIEIIARTLLTLFLAFDKRCHLFNQQTNAQSLLLLSYIIKVSFVIPYSRRTHDHISVFPAAKINWRNKNVILK